MDYSVALITYDRPEIFKALSSANDAMLRYIKQSMFSAQSRSEGLKITRIVFAGGNSKNYIATFKILKDLCKFTKMVPNIFTRCYLLEEGFNN